MGNSKLWGNIKLVVETENAIFHECAVPNKELLINNHLLEEHDIWISKVGDKTYELSSAICFKPNAQTENEAFNEASDIFSNDDVNLSTYFLEYLNHELIELKVKSFNFEWSDFENPSIGVFI